MKYKILKCRNLEIYRAKERGIISTNFLDPRCKERFFKTTKSMVSFAETASEVLLTREHKNDVKVQGAISSVREIDKGPSESSMPFQ